MKTIIIAWGSLIWDPSALPLLGTWQENGPILPLEFSRISRDGRLTLVIDTKNGQAAATRFALSPCPDLDDAVEDLRKREGTTVENIGFIDLEHQTRRSREASIADRIQEWARDKHFTAVVWTDLPSNFLNKREEVFSLDNAERYLRALPEPDAERARTYFRNAPAEVNTPLRRRLQDSGWL